MQHQTSKHDQVQASTGGRSVGIMRHSEPARTIQRKPLFTSRRL